MYTLAFTSGLTMVTVRESNSVRVVFSVRRKLYSPPKLAISAHRISPYKHTKKFSNAIQLQFLKVLCKPQLDTIHVLLRNHWVWSDCHIWRGRASVQYAEYAC